MGTNKSRREKHAWLNMHIKRFFNRNPDKTFSKGKMLAQFAVETFSTIKTGAEILDLFASVNMLKIEGDVVSKGKEYNL